MLSGSSRLASSPSALVPVLPALFLTAFLTACGPHVDVPNSAPAEPPSGTQLEDESRSSESEDYKNRIRWSTASEVENAGFNVYRSESEDGPFERMNAELIEGGYTTDEPSDYSFVDREIDPHRSYFYYVESVSLSGVRERFTPVIEAGPKLPAEPKN